MAQDAELIWFKVSDKVHRDERGHFSRRSNRIKFERQKSILEMRRNEAITES
jgi:hypothetical protein